MSDLAPDCYDSRAFDGEICPILPTAIDPDAMSVVRRLLSAGHRAYFVGGCVRDLLLGVAPKDFDIATSARPRQVKKLFRNARIIGRRFRLVHVLFHGNKQIEVSTFRRDPNEGGGGDASEGSEGGDFGEAQQEGGEVRADDGDDGDEDLLIREDNVYGSEGEDALRRDFTINGLFYDVQNEEVVDYVGGVPDVRRRTLRTIGDPSRRLREDPVRILRAVKFSTRLRLSLDPLLAAAMADHHEDLTRSAPPRVFEEILRILGGVAPDRAVEVLVGLGVFRVLFPEMRLGTHDGAPDPKLARLLARLRTMAEIDRGRRSLPTALYLAVLFWDELIERMVGSAAPTESAHRPPSQSMDDFLRPLGQRCRMAKRDTARARAAMLALRRLDPRYAEPGGKKRRRRGGMGEFVRREFFADALLLMEISYRAEGLDLAPLAEWQARREELHAPPRSHDRRHDASRDEPHDEAGEESGDEWHGDEAPRDDSPRDDSPRHDSHRREEAPQARQAAAASGGDSVLHRRRRRRRGRRAELFGPARRDDGEPA